MSRAKFISHNRIINSFQSKSTKDYHLRPCERIMSNNEHYLVRARKIGPFVEELIKSILLSGNGFVDTRKVWGILSLEKEREKRKEKISIVDMRSCLCNWNCKLKGRLLNIRTKLNEFMVD